MLAMKGSILTKVGDLEEVKDYSTNDIKDYVKITQKYVGVCPQDEMSKFGLFSNILTVFYV